MLKSRLSTLVTSNAGDERAIFHVVNEDVDLFGFVKRRCMVLDISTELQEVAKEGSIVEKVQVTLTRVSGDEGAGLVMKGWVRAKEDVLDGFVAVIASSGSDQTVESAVFRKHSGLGENTINDLSHAVDRKVQEVGEVRVDIRTDEKTTFTTMIRTETPERMCIDAKIQASLNKFGVPGTYAGMRVIVAVRRSLEKFLFFGVGLINVDSPIR
jgi:hypothetical protein